MKKKIALIALAVTAVLFTACAAENTPSAVSQHVYVPSYPDIAG